MVVAEGVGARGSPTYEQQVTCSRSVFREDGEEHLSEVHVLRNSTGRLENVFSDEEVGMNEEGIGKGSAATWARSHPSRREM